MAAQKKKSKKRSVTKSWQPDPNVVYFLDENLGGQTISGAIRARGATVETHLSNFPAGTDDETWLSAVTANGWMVITRDKKLRFRPNEIATIRRVKARVLVVTGGQMTGPDLADLLARKLKAIEGFAKSHAGSFVATVSPTGQIREFRGK